MSQPQQNFQRSTYVKTFPKKYEDYASFVALISNDGEPSCYEEAMDASGDAKWKLAIKEAIDALEKNKTWDLVEIPIDRKVVCCK